MLKLDHGLCMEEALGRKGLRGSLVEALRFPLEAAERRLGEERSAGRMAWRDLPHRHPDEVLRFAQAVQGRFDNVVVLGMGGSALGTTALSTALRPQYGDLFSAEDRRGYPRLFVVDNVDPDQISALLTHLDLGRTLVNVISKSGSTAETMANYLVVRGLMEEAVGRGRVREHFVFTTDQDDGVLRAIAGKEGIKTFEVPRGVGGRFSVLSAVGLLPAALAGIDIQGLLAGARDMDGLIKERPVMDNPAYLYAAIQFLMDTHFGRDVCVMMPYSARLRDVADWFRQLWAESLGKATDREGRTVNVGQTPVKALGATDQHSQIQLYAEGPDNKVITFLRVHHFGRDAVIPDLHPEHESLAYMQGKRLSTLMEAELKGTVWALARRGRPSLTLTLPKVDSHSVGQLMYLLEVATAVAGELYNINAFDQPGVELGKEAAYALLGREGYQEMGRDIEAYFKAHGGESIDLEEDAPSEESTA